MKIDKLLLNLVSWPRLPLVILYFVRCRPTTQISVKVMIFIYQCIFKQKKIHKKITNTTSSLVFIDDDFE